MENNFNLKKFLVENRLTTNSRMVNENEQFLDAVFDHINDELRSGNISRKDFRSIKRYIDSHEQELSSRQEENPKDVADDLIVKQVGELNEGGFYAPEYLKKTYGAKTAQEIEDDIRDNGGPNDWDYFTSLNSAEEVEDFISDLK